eukprot:3476963-Alexandrium_andersonii.AAC.1
MTGPVGAQPDHLQLQYDAAESFKWGALVHARPNEQAVEAFGRVCTRLQPFLDLPRWAAVRRCDQGVADGAAAPGAAYASLLQSAPRRPRGGEPQITGSLG